MRVLITGADGFAGRHLVRELGGTGYELHGTSFRPYAATAADADMPDIAYHTLDLRDETAVAALIADLKPDQIYHLAGIANVGQSYSAVWNTLENNIRAQVNLILACLEYKPRLLVVSSGDIYGDGLQQPATEESPLRPANPYSVSKVTQDMLGLQYFLSSGMPILRARPFNHLGPGQSRGFVAPDFALQVAQIEAGQQEPLVQVGSLTSERDFTDVRDVVRAYHLIMEQGEPGEVYNIASGTARPIRWLLETLLSYSSKGDIPYTVNTTRLRPAKVSRIWGDASRLRALTGWAPAIPLEQTLHDVLDDCRQRVAATREESK